MKRARIATDMSMDFRFSFRNLPRSLSVKKNNKNNNNDNNNNNNNDDDDDVGELGSVSKRLAGYLEQLGIKN